MLIVHWLEMDEKMHGKPLIDLFIFVNYYDILKSNFHHTSLRVSLSLRSLCWRGSSETDVKTSDNACLMLMK